MPATRFAVALTACVLSLSVLTPLEVNAQPLQTVYNTRLPRVIRVAIRANNNPSGKILYVQTIGFQEYCDDVLPNEWLPTWNLDALKAGAVAIKMFAWYHTLHPVTQGGLTYDVDNTTNFQQFKYKTGTPLTNKAVRDTWKIAYVPQNAEVKELNYRAGMPNNPNWPYVGSNTMSQWGSEYWCSIGKLNYRTVLNLFYPNHQVRWI
ncbi:SpoIID/LytB domain-containing protein [Alicyclobacillus sp. SO9]|uniref:SpoIID/LytB domain-containing protein n=1 Tax=Alicyclobacillus sp. SO9 TaxID=2665646 RepID=UPI0018E75408|nr:SpoIID/LytB domain-containing protein [Alicyclobacillus sp. SO9]QQE77694.1 SpoIID/LytB domain-containing protein [Alicyclobacillus sp. SO9]